MRVPARKAAAAVTVAMLALSTPAPAAAVPTRTIAPASPASLAAAAYARMTTGQRAGQLLMGAVPGDRSTAKARAALGRYEVGNAVLLGQSNAGIGAAASLLEPVRRTLTQAEVLPFLAVDQEGGEVQHLKGPGFSTIPSALRQGRLAAQTLRSKWVRWASQLHRAGINLDLAPVSDVVPRSIGVANQPIGRYHREYGHTPAVVSTHVAAVVRGIRDAGLDATAKHFPGLGRATGNTDTSARVTDPTTADDPYLRPFARAITAGAAVIMVSTAVYPSIDAENEAAFSHLITTTILRGQLGFTGIIVSDSLTAASVSAYTYASRAVRALDAGVDILLVGKNAPVAAMTAAIADRTRTDAEFASVVRTAVLRVLTAKAQAGLITT